MAPQNRKKNVMSWLGLSSLINRKHRKTRIRYSFGCMELIIIIIILIAIPIMMLVPALKQAREKARRMSCVSNLKEIGFSLKQYTIDYADRFPPFPGANGLELLRKNDYLTDYKIYACPSTTTIRGTGTVPLMQGQANANCDYAFAAPMMEGDSDVFGRADSGIAADIFRVDISRTNYASGCNEDTLLQLGFRAFLLSNPPNPTKPNHDDYGNILFHDGHVSGFAGASWYVSDNRGGSFMWPNVENVPYAPVETTKISSIIIIWLIRVVVVIWIIVAIIGAIGAEKTAKKERETIEDSIDASKAANSSPSTNTSLFSSPPSSSVPQSIQKTKTKSMSTTTIVIVIALIVGVIVISLLGFPRLSSILPVEKCKACDGKGEWGRNHRECKLCNGWGW